MPDRFLIVDDHPLFRDALRSALESAFPSADIADADTIAAAKAALAEPPGFNLLLLDLSMPGVVGFDALLSIRGQHPRLPIVVVSGVEDRTVVSRAFACGISGFISKATRKPDLIDAIRIVMAGSVFVPPWYATRDEPVPLVDRSTDLMRRLQTLTPQQMRVLDLVRQGKPNKQIAHELNVGETTAKAHVSEILRKLNVRSRTLAVTEVARMDLSGLDPQPSFAETRHGSDVDRPAR